MNLADDATVSPMQKRKGALAFMQRLSKHVKMVSFDEWRKPCKQSIALLLGIIMTLNSSTRTTIGQGSLLCTIVVVFYFPARTFGVVVEDVIYGTVGALITAAYAQLAIFTADLARDDSNPSPVQPKSSGVLALYLWVGAFVASVVRFRVPRANFACINSYLVMAFTLTVAPLTPGYNAAFVWAFLIPICIGGLICIVVSALIWPEDSMTNFMNVLVEGLEGHDAFFKEHSEAFYSLASESVSITLPSLHDRLRGCMLLLIDCKRAVHRDIVFSRLNGTDVSKLVKVVKAMRTPLHGVGLSYVLKQDLYRHGEDAEQAAMEGAIKDMVDIFKPLTETCSKVSADVCARLKALHSTRPQSILGSFLWPFPRHFWATQSRPRKERPANDDEQPMTSESFGAMIDHFANGADKTMWSMALTHNLHKHERALHLIGLYRYQLRNYVQMMVVLLETVEELEQKRHRRRFWFPTVKALKKRYWGALPHEAEAAALPPDDPLDLTLNRTNTRREVINDLEMQRDQSAFIVESGKLYCRDPDVDPPTTRSEHFFFQVNQLHQWMMDSKTIMAVKVASGAVFLSIPFFLPHTAGWYYDWRGNWAVVILLIWMTPTSGMFLYANGMRILGTAAGGVSSILLWEISRGNPYGLAIVLFIYFMLVYYIFVHKPPIRMFATITTVTTVLVITYSYDYEAGLLTSGSSEVWIIAGKRMLLVLIGFVAATILSLIPAPVNARIELRKSLAHTLRDISHIYSFLTSEFLRPSIASSQPTEEQKKWFRRRAIDLRRQIADERSYLHLSQYEPPLRGKFPTARYKKLLEAVDTLTDLTLDMGFALTDVKPVWRVEIARTLSEERRDYVASIMTTMKLIAAILSAKMALPPYMLEPGEARERFVKMLQARLELNSEDINHPSFLSYSAYVTISAAFVKELQCILETMEHLVGVEDPREWMRRDN